MTTHDAGRAVTGDFPVDREWYPNECVFCTREAALECADPSCRARRLGEDRAVPSGGEGLTWPRVGSCGACGRAAREFPSRRWEHVGAPCLARSQSAWRIDDIYIKRSCRFVPDGEPLPEEPSKWHMHETKWTEEGYPIQLAICNSNHMHSVREYLAAEAESRDVARG